MCRLPIVIDRTPDGSTTLMLARQHRLSVYEASYLELALRLSLPLATLNKELRQAAVVSGSVLLGEAARP
jgi:predicted nucleic acid-binding protein